MNEISPPIIEKQHQPWGFWGTTVLSTIIMILYFFIQFGVVFVIVNFTEFGSSISSGKDFYTVTTNGFILSLSIIVSAPVCLCLTLWIIRFRKGITVRDYIGFRGVKKREFVRWFFVMVMLILLFGMVNVLAPGLLFGAARIKTGSTYLTLSLHCLNNLASTI